MIDFACKRFDMEEIVRCAFGFTKAEFKIFKIFLSEKEYSSTREISKKTRLDLTTVQKGVKKMHEKEILERRQKNIDGGGYLFSYKIRSRKEVNEKTKAIIRNWTEKVEKEIDKWG